MSGMGQWMELAAAASTVGAAIKTGEEPTELEKLVKSMSREERGVYMEERHGNIKEITDSAVRGARAFYMAGVPIKEAVATITPISMKAFEKVRALDIDPDITMQSIPDLIGAVYADIRDYPSVEGPEGYKAFISLSGDGMAAVISKARAAAVKTVTDKRLMRNGAGTQLPGAKMGGMGVALLGIGAVVIIVVMGGGKKRTR